MKPLFISLSLLFAACTVKPVDQAHNNKKLPSPVETKSSEASAPNGKTPPKPSDPADDIIAIPTNIAGAHLTCAVRKEATDKSLESEIGCFLSESAGGKKIGADPKLSFSSSQPNSVTSESQADASIYHVLYRVKGESRDAILQATQSLDSIALYADKSFKTERIAKVLKPAVELDDYEAPIVREQAIDKDENGSL